MRFAFTLSIVLLTVCSVPAFAQSKAPASLPICDPLHLLPGCRTTATVVDQIQKMLASANQAASAPSSGDDSGNDPLASLAAALAKPFQDVAAFITGDSDQAVALSTVVPSLQDGNGQQCWLAMKEFSQVIVAHPVPLTLKLQTDVEAFRLLGMAANDLCANVHCTQVFADMSSVVQAAAPLNVGAPIPTLHDFCSKIPQIAKVAPVSLPVSAPITVPVTPDPVPLPTPAPAPATPAAQ